MAAADTVAVAIDATATEINIIRVYTAVVGVAHPTRRALFIEIAVGRRCGTRTGLLVAHLAWRAIGAVVGRVAFEICITTSADTLLANHPTLLIACTRRGALSGGASAPWRSAWELTVFIRATVVIAATARGNTRAISTRATSTVGIGAACIVERLS